MGPPGPRWALFGLVGAAGGLALFWYLYGRRNGGRGTRKSHAPAEDDDEERRAEEGDKELSPKAAAQPQKTLLEFDVEGRRERWISCVEGRAPTAGCPAAPASVSSLTENVRELYCAPAEANEGVPRRVGGLGLSVVIRDRPLVT
jgi:hypothetical protein